MGIFRRGTKDTSAGRSTASTSTDGEGIAQSADPGLPESGLAGRTDHDLDDHGDPGDLGERGGPDDDAAAAPSRRTASRSRGPFDRSEVQGLEGRLDLGALWLTGVPGMELRIEVEEESENLVGVTAVLGQSAVQLQAFAAPRTEGIWDEIRTEIAASVTSAGGTADKTSGPLGAELQARMPDQGPDGRTVFSPVRFVGIDGPRWFLRAVLSGPAATDEDAAAALLDVVRSTVVVRGDEAMAPRELLPLKLPEQPATTRDDGSDMDLSGQEAAEGTPSLNDLKPFERGPEITEIR